MKRNEILGEHKKGTKAVKYNKKPANPSVAHAKAKEKLAPVKPLEEEGISEMRYKRDAYQRDYDSSVAGMGKRDSLAYQLDGGANDEGWDEEPRQRSYRAPQQSSGMYFYNVQAGQEGQARAAGLRQSKNGKWYSKSPIASKEFGNGRFWQPKNEAMGAEVGKIAKVDPTTKKATLTKPDGSSMEVDSTALKPTPDGKMAMDTPDANEIKAGTSVVSTESADLTAMLRIAGLR